MLQQKFIKIYHYSSLCTAVITLEYSSVRLVKTNFLHLLKMRFYELPPLPFLESSLAKTTALSQKLKLLSRLKFAIDNDTVPSLQYFSTMWAFCGENNLFLLNVGNTFCEWSTNYKWKEILTRNLCRISMTGGTSCQG